LEGVELELTKNKYHKSEVQKMLEDSTTYYEDKLFEQKTRIDELIKENQQLLSSLEVYKTKEQSINNALISADKEANDLIERSKVQYAMVVESLKKFYLKWNLYFKELKDKYPLYPAVNKALNLAESLNKIFTVKDERQVIEELKEELYQTQGDDGRVFDPKRKIEDYIAATSENGFNINDVLNPGELELEDLCKELGLIEE
jgi:hypothetical protein